MQSKIKSILKFFTPAVILFTIPLFSQAESVEPKQDQTVIESKYFTTGFSPFNTEDTFKVEKSIELGSLKVQSPAFFFNHVEPKNLKIDFEASEPLHSLSKL